MRESYKHRPTKKTDLKILYISIILILSITLVSNNYALGLLAPSPFTLTTDKTQYNLGVLLK